MAERLNLKVCFAKRSNGDGTSARQPALSLHWHFPGGLRKFWGAGMISQAPCSTSLPVKQARLPPFKQSGNTLEKDFDGKRREKEQRERSPQTLCLSTAAWVFIYPPALWLWRFFCSSQRDPQLLQGSGEDPKTRATAKPPSLSKEQPQGCTRANERKVRPAVLELKIERKMKTQDTPRIAKK